MIGQILNGYKVVATGLMARDTSVLLGVNTGRGDKYVVATIATEAVLKSATEPPTFWSSGYYTSDLTKAVETYLGDVETDPERFERLIGHVEAPAVAVYTGTPHPDYPDMVWSEPRVEGLVLPAIEAATSPAAAAKAIMAVLDEVGYDSMDREMAFWIASQTKGWDYDTIYDAWLA